MSKHGAHSVARKDRARPAVGHGASGHARARHAAAHVTPEEPSSVRRLAERIALGAVGVALVAFVAFSVFAPPSAQRQEVGAQELQDVFDKVDQANTHVAAMSELLANGLSSDEDARQARELIDQHDGIADEMLRTKKHLNAIRGFLGTDDARAAELLLQGIEGRQDMVEYGMPLLEASLSAYELAPQVQELWQELLDGHAALNASAAHIEIGTTSEVKKALASDKKAKENYERVLQLADGLGQAVPGYDFAAERSYAEKQLQAAGEAIAADEALLDGKTKTAKQHMTSYQQAATEAASIAESLPATADDLLKSIYYSLGTDKLSIADAEKSYAEATERTTRVDGELADYRTSKGLTP